MWRGVRVRITCVAALAVMLVLVVTAMVLLAVQRRILTDGLDESLAVAAAELARTTRDADPTPRELEPFGDDDSIAQIVAAEDEVVASTANFAAQAALPAPSGGRTRVERTAPLLPGEPHYRIVSVNVNDFVVHVASPIDDIEESITALRRGLIGMIPIVTALIATLVWWLVGRTLRPVESIRAEVASISGESLHRRVPEPASGDEIERLATTMNAMLDRIEQSSEARQQFVADASHELRSPLTRMRSELEIDLAHPDSADLVATHRSVLDEIEQMQQLVDDLLVLTRHDNSAPARPNTAVDLDDIVSDEIRRIDTTKVIDATGVSGAQVDGDAADLARVVRNLLTNAVRHALSRVTVTLSERGGVAILTVTDDGGGIAPPDHERVFERFSRLDEARTAGDGGAGLGLAIASSIVERHGGKIRIDPPTERSARFVVELPASSADASSGA